MRVLIVEDSSIVRRFLVRAVMALGSEPWAEESPDDWPEDWVPELVLYDLHPFGWAPLKTIMALAPEARIVMITGDDGEAAKLEGEALGVMEWLPKPFTEDRLRKVLEG